MKRMINITNLMIKNTINIVKTDDKDGEKDHKDDEIMMGRWPNRSKFWQNLLRK